MPQAEIKLDSSKWSILAVTRFILAFIVMVGHISSAITLEHDWTRWGLWLNQGSAVFGFLILSGYSIAASLDRETHGFYLRRIWRIYPVYILSIVLSLFVGYLSDKKVVFPNGDTLFMPETTQVIATVFMLQTFIVTPFGINGPLWTLAVEWWNYVLAPIYKKTPNILLGGLILVSLIYNIKLHPSDISKIEHGGAFLCISWYWLSGFAYFRSRRSPWGYVVLFLPVMMAYASDVFVGRAILIALVAIALADEVSVPQMVQKIFNWLGDLSYPLYVIQIPMMIMCNTWHLKSGVVICLITLCVAAAVYCCFEVPLRVVRMRVSDIIKRKQACAHREKKLCD